MLQPVFRREALGEPMEYCGPVALGDELEARINRSLPEWHHGPRPLRRNGEPAVTLLIAFLAAVAAYLLATTVTRAPAGRAARPAPDAPADAATESRSAAAAGRRLAVAAAVSGHHRRLVGGSVRHRLRA